MTRADAQSLIYEIINSGIVSEEIEDGLYELANTLCYGDFDDCEEFSSDCIGCQHLYGGAICEE